MSVTIELSPETTARLRAEATVAGVGLDIYIAQLVENPPRETPLTRAMRTLTERSSDERAALRADVLAHSRPARDLPMGKTLEDVVVGSWPGTESNEEVAAALQELS